MRDICARNVPPLALPPFGSSDSSYDVMGFENARNMSLYLTSTTSRQYVGVQFIDLDLNSTQPTVSFAVWYNLSTITTSFFSQSGYYDYTLEAQVAVSAAVLARTPGAEALSLVVRTMPFPAPFDALNINSYRFAPDFLATYGLSLACFVAQIAAFILTANAVIYDSGSGLRDALAVFGVKDSMYLAGHVVQQLVVSALASLIACVTGFAFSLPLFTASFALVFIVIWMGFMAMVAFALFIGTITSSRTTANAIFMLVILCGGGVCIVFAFSPGYYVYRGGAFISLLCSLFPPFNFARLLADITAGVRYYFSAETQTYVRSGPGFSWRDLHSAAFIRSRYPDVGQSIPAPIVALEWLLVDTLLYFLLSWYCDTVRLGKPGGGKHAWWFLCSPRYWGLGSRNQSREERDLQDPAVRALAVRHLAPDLAAEFLDTTAAPPDGDSDSDSDSDDLGFDYEDAARDGDESDGTDLPEPPSTLAQAAAAATAAAAAAAAGTPQQGDLAGYTSIGGIHIETAASRARTRTPALRTVPRPHRPRPLTLQIVRLSMLFASQTEAASARDRSFAVDDLTLGVRRGQLLALLGHNGAGKSTTIRMLTGLLKPTAGEAWVCGHAMTDDPDGALSSIGVCFSSDVMWPDLTAAEHLLFWARVKGVPRADLAAVVEDCLTAVNLIGNRDQLARSLSGGTRRRLSVVAATLGDPQLLILDEPTTGMDIYNRQLINELIRRIKHQRTVLLSTHSLDEANDLADKVAVLADGKLRAVGTPADLKRRYGAGYRLRLAAQLGQELELAELISSALPAAQMIAQTGALMHVSLENCAPGAIASFLRRLDSAETSEVVKDWTMERTPLEQVFLRIMGSAGHDEAYAGYGAASPPSQAVAPAVVVTVQTEAGAVIGELAATPTTTLLEVRSQLRALDGVVLPPAFLFLVGESTIPIPAEAFWRAVDIGRVLIIREDVGVAAGAAAGLANEAAAAASAKERMLESELAALQAQLRERDARIALLEQEQRRVAEGGGIRAWLGW